MPMETWSVSASTADVVVGVDKKLWVGSGLFENCKSLFSTQGAVFGSETFGYTDWIQLPCQMMLQFVPPRWLVRVRLVSQN